MISSPQFIDNSCRFCSLTSSTSSELWNEPLISDGSVTVVPTKGAIVSPWLLLIPQSHVPTASLLPINEKRSVSRLICHLRRLASATGQHLIIFENGSPYFGADISCGIDHVHIHIVALSFNLVQKLQTRLPEISGEYAPWSPHTKNLNCPYIYFDDGIRQYYFDASSAPSQFLRQLIAEMAGHPKKFHYDTFPNIENVILTAKWFEKASSAISIATAGTLS
ncbi:MAG: hypothetical protein WA902_15950 [Thermosynechococcaceae cyanobacterium]